MAKELPYFRFTAHEWLNDDISLESYETKGFFIDLCAYYWSQDCDCTLAKLTKKFSNAINLLNQLMESDIIKHESKHDKIKIDFLMTQYDLLSEKRKLRQDAGSKGGNAKAMLKQKPSYKDKDNNKDNNKNKDNNIDIPSFELFKLFAFEKKPAVSESALKAKYDSWIENDWVTGNDKKIKNWKSTLLNTLPYIPEGFNSNPFNEPKLVR